jgi:hypothetical protein
MSEIILALGFFILAACLIIAVLAGLKALITGKLMTRRGNVIYGLPARMMGLALIVFAVTPYTLIGTNGALLLGLMTTGVLLMVGAFVMM